MRSTRTGRSIARCALAATLGAACLAGAPALAARAITKRNVGSIAIAAGRTATLTVPYPDALEYGNARYRGAVEVLAPRSGASGRTPELGKVRILERGSVEGGSAYQVRARNGNPAGTAAIRVAVTATTVEPLPHS